MNMQTILRTLALFAPLLITVAVAVAVVFAILHATGVLIGMAIATGVLLLAGVLGAVVAGSRDKASREDARIRTLVVRLARTPSDPEAREELASRFDDFDQIRLVVERFVPQSRDTVRQVLLALDADQHLERMAERGLWDRVAAARNLAWLAPPELVGRLERLARDEEPEVALAGAMALATVPTPEAYRVLLRLLADGPLPPSRVAAVLEESALPDPLPVLSEVVGTGAGAPFPVRFWGAYLAGRSGDARAAVLLGRLVSDPDPNVRANAAEAMGAMPGADPVADLMRLSSDDVWYVRAHAARALGDRGDVGTERLAGLLTDESWWVRENAARSLSRIGPASITALRGTLSSPDRFARNKAAEVLVGLGFLEGELQRYLKGNGARWEARESLVLMGRAEAVASLSDRFLSVEGEHRPELARVLMEINDPRLRPTVQALDRRGPPPAASGREGDT